MNEMTFIQAQADMRRGYISGAPGVFMSGLVWLVAGSMAATLSAQAGVIGLLVGGAAIFPLSVLLAKALGRSGTHAKGNPLGGLAIEGTLWLLAGIAIAYGMHLIRPEWFFPAMLLVIGGRYLTFRTLYGMRVYWVLGGTLCIAAVALVLLRAAPPLSAFAGAAIELFFAAGVTVQARREQRLIHEIVLHTR